MTSRQGLYSRVAAIGVAGVLAAMAPQNVMAQAQSAIANVAIDNDDIGGVVTGANGPEAGVWVIAETTELPTKFARIVVTDDQGRYRHPRSAAARTTRSGCAATGWSIRPRLRAKPGQQLNLAAIAGAERCGGSALLSGDLLVLDDEDSAGRVSSAARPTFPTTSPRSTGCRQMKNIGCVGCHQLGQEATRTIPAQLGRFKSGAGSLDAPHPVRPGRRDDDEPHCRTVRRGTVHSISAIGPIASPRASCRRPSRRGLQGVERNIVVTSWEWSAPNKHYSA